MAFCGQVFRRAFLQTAACRPLGPLSVPEVQALPLVLLLFLLPYMLSF